MKTEQELKYKNKIEEKFPHIRVLSVKEYKPGMRSLELECNVHGTFVSKYPSILYTKFACEKCSHDFRTKDKLQKSRISQEELTQTFTELYGNKYSFKLSKTPNKMFITCPHHGEKERYISSVKKRGCVECYSEQSLGSSTIRVSFEVFFKKLSKEKKLKFKYDKSSYISFTKEMKIECPFHGTFLQVPTQHLKSLHGCFKCIPKRTSKKETQWLLNIGVVGEVQYPIKVGSKKYLADSVDLNNNTVYEFLGDFWHGNLSRYSKDTINKVCKVSMNTLFLKTEQKFKDLNSLGYIVKYSWESDPPLTQRIFKGHLEC